MTNKPITVNQHDMPNIALIAKSNKGIKVASKQFSVKTHDMHRAVAEGRKYVKLGCMVEIFMPRGSV